MGLRFVLISSGAIGLALGLAHFEWQWAVEHAQVMTGIVTYPIDHPNTYYMARAWSLVSQLAALALWAGLSERAISWILSGLLGVVSCQALAMVVYAASGRALASVGAVFVLILSRAVDWGPAYPISLYGTGHTFGIAGQSTAVLAVGLFGAGATRAAAFLAPVVVAIHPALGAFLLLVFLAAWVWEFARDRAEAFDTLRRVLAPAAAGVLLAAVSFAVRAWGAPDPPAIDAATTRPLVSAFVEHWDGHRQAVSWGRAWMRIALGVALLGVVWPWLAQHLTTARTRQFLRVSATAAILGLAATTLTWMEAARLPEWISATMPGRFVNLAIFVAIPTLLGLTFTLPGTWGIVMPAVLAAGLVGSRIGPLPNQPTVVGIAFIVLLVAAARTRASQGPSTGTPLRRLRPRADFAWHGVLLGVVLVSIVAVGLTARRQFRSRQAVMLDWTNDPVFAATAGPGMLLTAGDLFLIQLRTRRPVLIDSGAIDVMSYAPEAAPGIERVLKGVYGMSVLAPPDGMRKEGRVPTTINRRIWEQYSREDWTRIGRDFGVSRVITYAGWQLALPSLMMGHGLQVFEIPAR